MHYGCISLRSYVRGDTMTYHEARDYWDKIAEDVQQFILTEMIRLGLKTNTPEGRDKFVELVENATFTWVF